MSIVRVVSGAALAAMVVCFAGPAQAVGLFVCVDPAGREICVVDSGAMTDFHPSGLCNASCPPCGGRCDAAKYYPGPTGYWQQSWQVAPGITGNNILVPGGSPQEDARTIVREGLAAPAAPQTLPPAGAAYPPGTVYQPTSQPNPGYPSGYSPSTGNQPGTGYQPGATSPSGTGYRSGNAPSTGNQPGAGYQPGATAPSGTGYQPGNPPTGLPSGTGS